METVAGLARLIAFLAILIGTLLAVGLGASWLFFRYRRHNAERCARLCAERLGLVPRLDAEPGVPLWHGEPVGQAMVVAAHAWGTIDAQGARFTFFGTPMVAVAAPFVPPLFPSFVLTTARDAARSLSTGDFAFDQHFCLDSRDAESTLAILSSDDLRRSINRLRGPSTFWSGSGRLVEITGYGVLVRETIPRSRNTQTLGADVLAVALALRARSGFLPQPPLND